MFLSLLEVQHCTCVTVVLHTFVMLYVCTMWHMGCLWRSCISRRVIQSIVSEPVLLKYEISPLAYSNFIHNFVYMLYTSSAYIGFQCSFIPGSLCPLQFPYCDGTHGTHNKETGDNVGPVVIKSKKKNKKE